MSFSPAFSRIPEHSTVAAAVSSKTDQARLERWVRSPLTPQRLARRSRIVLLWMTGEKSDDIAREVGVSARTVKLWIDRYRELGAESLLKDAPGRGRHARIGSTEMLRRLAEAGLLDDEGRPTSMRRAAALLGVSSTAVWRAVHKSDGVSPHTTSPARPRR